MSPGLSENGFIVTMCPVIPEEKGPQGEGHQRALQGRGQIDPSRAGFPPTPVEQACSYLQMPPDVCRPPSIRSWRLPSSLPCLRAATLILGHTWLPTRERWRELTLYPSWWLPGPTWLADTLTLSTRHD